MAADLSYSAQALSVQTSQELECEVEAVVLREAWGTVWELTLAGPPEAPLLVAWFSASSDRSSARSCPLVFHHTSAVGFHTSVTRELGWVTF